MTIVNDSLANSIHMQKETTNEDNFIYRFSVVCVYLARAYIFKQFHAFCSCLFNRFVFYFVLNTFPFIIYKFSQFTHSHTPKQNEKNLLMHAITSNL